MNFERGSTQKARKLADEWLLKNLHSLKDKISLGLPEYDDRLKKWRIALHSQNGNHLYIGEILINENIQNVIESTEIDLIKRRIGKYQSEKKTETTSHKKLFYPAAIPNKVILGNCIDVLCEFPPDTAQLVFTSPPYYNAKPEYSEYVDYQEYLDFMRKVIVRVHSILSEGRFFVINISPVLVRRTSRSTSSKRIPIPFDLHRIFDSVGFEFIDDIIWVKPEGAGWNLGRGRRFKADRQPLHYKPVPVTEYILVYRKRTDKLIDWNLRKHHDPTLIEESKIIGEYDVTNIWNIHPSSSKIHPAVFPEELAVKVIKYYSFKDDMVLDPFAGTGTVGRVAYSLERRFMLIENDSKYFKHMKQTLSIIPITTRIDFDIHEKFRKEPDEF
ncbi:site-specific DNA-methyltransferase [candidate division KSB1 bacterium]|nr:site-specific DNA-methyltransferase [candidate division KSB1 bacterium]